MSTAVITRVLRDRFTWIDVVLALLVVLGIVLPELGVVRMQDVRQAGGAAQVAGPAAVQPALRRVRALPRREVHDPRRSGIVAGIVLGRTDDIPPSDWLLFRRSGLWHLLAASGQNVALVAALCVVCAIALGAGRMMGTLWALAAVPAYVVVVGGGASIVRAGIMAELALLGWLAGRPGDLRHSLLASAAVLELAWPGVHRSLGFQLSFACVVALAAWATPTTRWLEGRGVWPPLAAGVAATVVCTAATAPILVLATGSAPMLAGITNLVAVPLAGVILVVGLPSCVAGMVHPGWSHPGMLVCGWLAGGVLDAAQVGDALPLARTSSLGIASALPLLGALLRWGGRLPQPRRTVPAIAAAGAVLVLLPGVAGARSAQPVAAGHVRIAFLDVGQGMATLVAVPGHAVLLDTGPPDADVVSLIRREGVRRLDGVILSHDALDHRGALPAVAAALHPAWVAVPRNGPGRWVGLYDPGVPVVDACDGDRITLGTLTILVRNPPCARPRPGITGDDANDNAVVAVVQYGATSVLVPGDCEGSITGTLGLGTIDVLDVAHHGSADPGLPGLLTQLRPGLAVVSVGAYNPFGHPRAETIAALADAHVPALRTDRDGTVVLDGDGRALRRVS